jgi:xylulose-5-phosphate/fructose-6-phosphate phosphoketolase
MTVEFVASLSTMVDTPPSPDGAAHRATGPLSQELLNGMHRYWSAANYLTVGQIYLQENPLLREPLRREHIKQRLLSHWGTSTGLNFIFTHLNRLITQRNADAICIIGPGHGGPAGNAHAWLDGTYSEIYHPITQDESGMRILFRQFSTPGGVSSHCGAHLPGSIHEGCELGYALLHAYGAAFDNPDLIVACIIGDGEAETGALEGSWKGNKFLNPVSDGAVLPILDTLVFTGGIMENAAIIRERICAKLDFLGITLEPRENASSAAIISKNGESVTVRVIKTNEDLIVARQTVACCRD